MKLTVDAYLAKLTNLLLAPGTRAFERQQLVRAKQQVEGGASVGASWDQLKASLRPLAIRDNLTPDVADFYRAQTGDPEGAQTTDIRAHFQHDLAYQERAIFVLFF